MNEVEASWEMLQQVATLVVCKGQAQDFPSSQASGHLKVDSALHKGMERKMLGMSL